MQITSLRFNKKVVSCSLFYDYKNVINYDVYQEDELIATFKILSTLTGELTFKSKIYKIQPKSKFLLVQKLEIINDVGLKIGEIRFWGWTWRKPRLIVELGNRKETWFFNRNNPSIFKSRNSIYQTSLTSNDKRINYNVKLLEFLVPESVNECLRAVDGEVVFKSKDIFVAILGIYLNELLIFDEMDKWNYLPTLKPRSAVRLACSGLCLLLHLARLAGCLLLWVIDLVVTSSWRDKDGMIVEFLILWGVVYPVIMILSFVFVCNGCKISFFDC